MAKLIAEAVNLELPAETLDPKVPLFGGGLGLDSIDVLEIALAISRKYGFQLRSDDPANGRVFVSLRSLSSHRAAPAPVNYGTYLNPRHVCDGGDVGCSSRRRARSNMSILQGFPTKKCAPKQACPPPPKHTTGRTCAPSLGLRPGRASASLPGLSTGCSNLIRERPAPCASHPSRPGHNASRAYG